MPGHDAEAVNELVDAGCDVITCHLDSPRVAIETAEARGVETCGHAFDQAKLAPKGYVTRAEYGWTGMFEGFVETLQKGGTLPNYVIGGYDKGSRARARSARARRRKRSRGEDRNPGHDEQGRDLRRADQGQRRQGRGAGGNQLRALCRRAAKRPTIWSRG